MGYEDHFEQSVNRNEGKLFESPDTNSQVVWQDNRPFKHYLTPLRTATNQGIKWYKVSVEGEVEGFIREQDFVKYSFYGANESYYYVVNNPIKNSNPYYQIIRRNKIGTDTFELGMYWSYMRSKEKYSHTTLSGVTKLLQFEFFNAQCPGTNEEVLIADVGDSLTKIASSFGQGEAGWSEHRTVYIPVKLGDDKVLLVANGDVENIFNTYRVKLNTFNYPKDIGVPIEELVVIVKETYEPDETANQDEETYITKRTAYKEEFYHWKNNRLIKIKEK